MRDFNHTVNVLVNAYLNDTLEHGECHACAVGNLVFACNRELAEKDRGAWFEVVVLTPSEFRDNEYDKILALANDQVKSTGYSIDELKQIEAAFEGANDDFINEDELYYKPDTYHGLMAVVDVLAEIHGIDLEAKEEAKKLFVKA